MTGALAARHGAAALGLIVLVTAGCDERDRANPLDPLNAETGGVPDWLRAIAGNRVVELAWQRTPLVGFEAFQLLRSTEGGAFTPIARFEDPDSIAFADSSVTNGVEFTYRLDLLLRGEGRVELPSKDASPGSAVPWVLEAGSFGLLRFTPDGRNARVRTGSGGGHFDLAVSPDGRRVWAADYFGGELHEFADSGVRVSRVPVAFPFRIAVDHAAGVVWAASWRIGRDPVLYAFETDGDELARFPLRGEARDLIVDERTGACYVALGRGGGVARAALGGALVESGTAETIMMAALIPGDRLYGGDPLDGGVYGYDLETLALEVFTSEVASPQAMTFGLECLWVASGGDEIVCLDRTLGVRRRIEGVGLASALAADEESGTLWLALPAAGRVVRVDLSGEVRTRISLFRPFDVAIGRASEPGVS